MAYIFLSYAKSDRDSAFTIRDLLEDAGFSVWMDKNQSELKAWHWHKVQDNIREAGAVVLLVSDVAQKSAWLKRELEFAESLQKPLFPILIQGKGWSRLETNLVKLKFGLKIELPISFLEDLQSAMETAPKSSLPEQIVLKAYPKERSKRQTLILAVSLFLGSLLFLALISPLILREFTPSPLQITRVARETSDVQSTQTQNAYRREVITQSALNRQERATAVVQTQAAYQPEVASQSTLDAIATRPNQASINLTASAGNGVLPCTAIVPWSATDHVVSRYRNPINPPIGAVSVPRSGLVLILSEWIVNEEGTWYRVMREDGMNTGYVRGRDIVLSEECPR